MQNENIIHTQEPEPLFNCCAGHCTALPSDKLRVSPFGVICHECWGSKNWDERRNPYPDDWYDLPPFIPAYQAAIERWNTRLLASPQPGGEIEFIYLLYRLDKWSIEMARSAQAMRTDFAGKLDEAAAGSQDVADLLNEALEWIITRQADPDKLRAELKQIDTCESGLAAT